MTTVLNTLEKFRRNCSRMSAAEQCLVTCLRHFVCSASVCMLMGLAVAGQSFAQAPIGTAVAVVHSAYAKGPGGTRVLLPRQPVFSGDRISTGPFGEAQIRFRDGTRLVVGPNSSLVIDKFILADDRTAREVGIRLGKGALRFISSNSAEHVYSIRTPNGTTGVVAGIPGKGSVSPRSLTRKEIARLQNGCSDVFRKPTKYNPDTVAVCTLLASL